MTNRVENEPAIEGGRAKPDLPGARRAFLATLGLGAVGALAATSAAEAQTPSAADVFNFALNFEYLGAEFYLHALSGATLGPGAIEGTGTQGVVVGGHGVPFSDPSVRAIAQEFANDEVGHVRVLRGVLGGARIARPQIDLNNSFTVFARFAGLIPMNGTFDAFANDTNFLLSALVLEDVCVTALIGGTPFLRNNEFLGVAAGFLSTEAYQASILRTMLAMRGQYQQVQQISNLRDYFDGPTDLDQGIGTAQSVNIVPADNNSIAFGRTPQQVRNIAYGTTNGQPGGFFPNGLNGAIR